MCYGPLHTQVFFAPAPPGYIRQIKIARESRIRALRAQQYSYCGPCILPKAPLTDHLHTHACIQRVLPRHTNTLLTCIHVHGISGSDTDHICNQNSHPNL
eukprot:jgi/Botrbrau1/9556/Bobra.0089s0015.1